MVNSVSLRLKQFNTIGSMPVDKSGLRSKFWATLEDLPLFLSAGNCKVEEQSE